MTTFADFYAMYPRHQARKDAEKAWRQVLKEGVQPETIMAGLRRQLPMMAAKDKQFLPYPATWLRGWRWEDEAEAPSHPSLSFQRNSRAFIADINSQLFVTDEEPTYDRQIDLLACVPNGARH